MAVAPELTAAAFSVARAPIEAHTAIERNSAIATKLARYVYGGACAWIFRDRVDSADPGDIVRFGRPLLGLARVSRREHGGLGHGCREVRVRTQGDGCARMIRRRGRGLRLDAGRSESEYMAELLGQCIFVVGKAWVARRAPVEELEVKLNVGGDDAPVICLIRIVNERNRGEARLARGVVPIRRNFHNDIGVGAVQRNTGLGIRARRKDFDAYIRTCPHRVIPIVRSILQSLQLSRAEICTRRYFDAVGVFPE